MFSPVLIVSVSFFSYVESDVINAVTSVSSVHPDVVIDIAVATNDVVIVVVLFI